MSVASIHDYLVRAIEIKSISYLFLVLITSEIKRTVIIEEVFLVTDFDLMKNRMLTKYFVIITE